MGAVRKAGRACFGAGLAEDGWRAAFDRPLAIEEARNLDEVRRLVDWIDGRTRAGQWGVLLLAYESAPAFDPALVVRTPDPAGTRRASVPLAWAAAYDAPLDAADVSAWCPLPAPDARSPVPGISVPIPGARCPMPGARSPVGAVDWMPRLDETRFDADIARILAHITAGDTYQVNYTFPLDASFPHDPWPWFAACAREARVPFAACIDMGAAVVISLSPELFIERTGGDVRTRPMKGTTRRGRWLAEDVALADALQASDKARAENVMIVDLLRNDLGRLAQPGSVRVSDLCAIERYPTVWQMTSRVDARVSGGTDLWALLSAVFPCGSVTGAPKVRTMQIIADLEIAPRGIYTGAICLLKPGGDLMASVPIRTAVLDRLTQRATFSVGAGITSDSDAADEWAECLAKARVVRPAAVPAEAELLETMRSDAGAIVRREGHVRRLLDSAALFGWPVERAALDVALDAVAREHRDGTWRVRLVASREGRIRTTVSPFTPDARMWRVALAGSPIDTRSPLLFNKTTCREVYERARAAAPDADDVLLWNARGELTESTIANLIVEIDGARVTPPVSCGLLPGIFRATLLASGEVTERIVHVDDMQRATRLWLVNSLREWIEAEPLAGW